MGITDELQKESQVAKPTDDQGLKLLAKLAADQLHIIERIKNAEANLKEMVKELALVATKQIPDLMVEYGFEATPKLSNGMTITLNDVLQCSITKANEAAAFKWLKDHGHDDVIKNEIKTVFGRGEEEKAKDFYNKALEQGMNATQKAAVHNQTLKALIKDLKSKDIDVPDATFSVFEGKIAVIK